MAVKRAIYPGSFDPITNGHVDIVNRARRVIDEVMIGVIINPDKKPFFTLEKRIELVRQVFAADAGVRVAGFEGLLVDFAKRQDTITVIRGLRAVSDFDYEFQMALTNRNLAPDLDTVFFMTDERNSYLSSSLIKQLARFNGDISALVPGLVEDALKEANARE